MLHDKVKEKFNSTVKHIKAHPAIYGYAAGAVVGIAATIIVVNANTKDLKLVSLVQSLKRIHDEGLTALKFEMGAETLLLIPVDSSMLNID